MHTLLFDLRAVQPLAHGHHGGAEYARAVFKRLAATPGELRIKGFYDEARPLPDDVRSVAESARIELVGLRSSTSSIRALSATDRTSSGSGRASS
jgi:hypothetical protein